MKLRPFFLFIFVLLLLDFASPGIFPQELNLSGMPIIRNYLPSVHGGTPQNWAIIQDQRGIMYFANTGGLLEYDGASWRLIEIENEVARTVAIDSKGTIFVGGVDQFGLLEPDLFGNLKYKSLINYIPIEARNFGDIWTIWPVNDGVYFQSTSHIFFLRNSILYSSPGTTDIVKIWKSKSIFSPAFFVDDQYFVPEMQTGLCKIIDGSIKLVNEGQRFKDLTIYSMLSFEDK
ncbi:MAG TPA: hypothetical protein VIY47_16160, partial [Ignavibacteriaceae bacterium]